MKKLQRVSWRVLLFCMSAGLLLLNGFGMTMVNGFRQSASAQTAYYCDDGYGGEGVQVTATYTVEYDYAIEHNEYRGGSAPSLNNGGSGATNGCTANAGLNVIAFYDRFYTNLVPDYEPGVMVGGKYRYFPNMSNSRIQKLHETLYDYMNVNANGPGASEADFKNGLSRYINEQGYSVAYCSFHTSSNTVNLSRVQQMVNNNQVAVLFA